MQRRPIALALSTVILLAGIALIGMVYLNPDNNNDSILNFYVFGDSQGYQDSIHQIATIANEYRPDFVFHCGDLTPFGQESQYQTVVSALDEFETPVYTTPGNHDIRLGGGSRYTQHFGPSHYSFDIGSAHFSVLNTSTGDISEEEFAWLESDLSEFAAKNTFVFTHTPPFDPRQNNDHALTNATTATRLLSLFQEMEVDVVFSGHIHIFNESIVDGVRYIVTGGAGASLYAESENGGFYHFVNVTLSESGLTIEPVLLDSPFLQRDMVAVQSDDESVTLAIGDLLLLSELEGFSSFQNQFYNWRGYGTYKGVRISDLVELVGGMDENDTLRIGSNDGYEWNFSYFNVYPNSSWYDVQGDMILAYSLNGTLVPDWSDGMRLVMLAPDGGYSNEDYQLTSAPEMGYYIYESAGASWVRFVSDIEVIKH
ncbi:MAG: metallophosphoesterase family protein [Promethearchaeota archaeon]